MNTKLFKKMKSIAIAIVSFLPIWVVVLALFRSGSDGAIFIDTLIGGGYSDYVLNVPQSVNEIFSSFFGILGISGQYTDFVMSIAWTYIVIYFVDFIIDLLLLIPNLCKNAFSKGV